MSERGDSARGAGSPNLAARLQVARSQQFVGRVSELDLFRSAIADEPSAFAVLFLHGPGGVGKSALLHRLVEEADAAELAPVLLDGRCIEPTPQAFLAAIAAAMGVGRAAEAMTALRSGERPVLLIDTYEELTPLDGWVRQTLIPQLPADALVVIAGREPPSPGWRADPAWRDLLRVTSLRNLHPDDARDLLTVHAVPVERHDEALGLAGGHPLALVLVAELLTERSPTAPLSLRDTPDIVEALLERFVASVPGEAHREALAVCAHARVTTEALLRDAVPGASPRELFDWLQRRPFIDQVPDGLIMHTLVREVLDADLRWRDAQRFGVMHRQVMGHLARRVQETEGYHQEQAMLDLLHLNRWHPLTAGYFEWRTTGELWMEAVTPADGDALVALTARQDGVEAAALARYWLDRQPEAFRVFRAAGTTEPVGFLAHLVLWDAQDEAGSPDPVVASLVRYTRRRAPLRAGDGVSVLRFWISPQGHQDVATHHLVCTRGTIDWLTTPRLAWSFVTVADPDFWDPLLTFTDFHRAPEADVIVDGRRYGVFEHDWRAVPPAAWGERTTERQLADVGAGSESSRPPVTLEVLSQPEFEAAVRRALRGLARAGTFEGNPLLRSRVVVEHAGDRSAAAALRELLVDAVQKLTAYPRDEKLHRALVATYLKGAPTQEAAAERLALPYSTYRRHLAAGIERVVSLLWEQELYGPSSTAETAAGTAPPGSTAAQVRTSAAPAGAPPG